MKRILKADLLYNLHFYGFGIAIITGLVILWRLMSKMPPTKSYLLAFSGATISLLMILIFSNYARHVPARTNIYILPLSLVKLAWARILTPAIYIALMALTELLVIAVFNYSMLTAEFVSRLLSLTLVILSVMSFLFFLVDFNSANRNKYFKWISDFLASLVVFTYCAEGIFLLTNESARTLFDFSFTQGSAFFFGDLQAYQHISITAVALIMLFTALDIWAFRRRISFREN